MGCIAFPSKRMLKKVYSHCIYRLIIYVTTQTRSYHLGKTQLSAYSVMEKMSQAIQNDEMIGQAFEPKQIQDNLFDENQNSCQK